MYGREGGRGRGRVLTLTLTPPLLGKTCYTAVTGSLHLVMCSLDIGTVVSQHVFSFYKGRINSTTKTKVNVFGLCVGFGFTVFLYLLSGDFTSQSRGFLRVSSTPEIKRGHC